MLPTFVIGLREGVEASLIVGIVAAFLRQQGRRDVLRFMWAGVALAVVLCAGAAVVLELVNQDLPQRQQEGLETVVALVAVGMVTFMIVWMRGHAAGLATRLREDAASALARGSMWALVGMAFFAVLREGLETAVFLLAAFQSSAAPASAGAGAALGIAAALVVGFGIYRGGVRINLGRFFKLTAAVLVLVAAGLVASAVHTAHEASWLTEGQRQALDLSWLVRPGTVTSSLLTGILGLQPRPVVAEIAGWIVYAIPMLLFVLWPDRWRIRRSASGARATATAGAAIVSVAVAGLLLVACGSSSGSGGGSKQAARTVAVVLTDDGCAPKQASIPAGPATFDVQNSGSSKVTEAELLDASGKIVGEREDIAAGLSASFSVDLRRGRYVIACPNARNDRTALAVVD